MAIDEFSIARAFAAVGVAAALYGISLSAGALISQPPDAGKEDVKWFLRHSAAPESVHEVPNRISSILMDIPSISPSP